MSVVVGAEGHDQDRPGVWLAWDAFCGDYHQADLVDGKVFRTSGGLIVGNVGTWRATQVLRYHLATTPPPHGEDVEAWCVRTLVPDLRALAEEHPCPGDDEESNSGPFRFLLALHGQLIDLTEDGTAHRSPFGYAAVGSGGALAYGALAALADRPPREQVEAAVRVAALHCPTVSLPLDGRVRSVWVPA